MPINGNSLDVIDLDFKKHFDTVSHTKLIRKWKNTKLIVTGDIKAHQVL